MKSSRILAALVLLPAAWSAQAALSSAGDLMFTTYNADEDGWSMVALADIVANTTVYFTDNEWTGSAFNTGESYHQWVSGASTIAAGTVIRFSAIDVTSLSSSVGSLSRATVSGSTNYGISQSADTIYAYLGTDPTAPTTFLAAITSAGSFSAAEGLLTGTGLTVGTSAVALTNSSDFAEYTGARAGQSSFAGYKALVGNVANWNVQGDGTFAATLPNTTAFTISEVPEPGALLLSMAGLGALGIARRRRN